MKEITLAVLLLYVNAFANSDYQKGRLKSVTSSGQWVAVPRYQATTYIVKHYYTVELNDVIYIGNYQRASRWNYNAKDFQSAQDVEVRIDGGHMFIKRPDGKDWKVAIQARIDPAEDSGGGQLTANPRKAASKHHDSALWLQEVGEFGRAIHEYETSLRLNPEDWTTHYDFGVMLYERPSSDYALEEFRAVVKLAPKNSMAHCMVGMILLDKGELNTGIEELTTAIRLDSKLALAHFGYGTGLEAKGELPQALEEYGRALHLERDFREAKSAMTRVQGKYRCNGPETNSIAAGVGRLQSPQVAFKVHPRPFPTQLFNRCKNRTYSRKVASLPSRASRRRNRWAMASGMEPSLLFRHISTKHLIYI